MTGKFKEEHLSTLEKLFSCLQKAGLWMKHSKCEFMKQSVTYLGHHIDEKGLLPLADKVEAIHDSLTPKSVQELKSYLGLLTLLWQVFS